ncbi:unnamed protein product [Pocillopora meandrina]|uniref:receptor protein-tyrosine kinase n=1 Tax=Pocillopora meandrina TaxID=46732 RepID=A0AAU9VR39_9CNID|nr:unnamed protein product [Pocillopora meandrina]
MYTSCVVSGQQPNVWLRSNPVTIPSAVIQVYIAIQYRSKNCTMLDGDDFCREYFDLYVHQSWNKEVPEPPGNNSTYSKIAKITAPIPGVYARVTKISSVSVKGRYITLAFHNQGSCSVIYSVVVSYFFCPEFTSGTGLVSLPRSMAPANNSEPVEGRCVVNAVHYQGAVMLDCQSDGFWNISSLQGGCVCKEKMENAGGECRDCPERKYNDQNGLNCTVIPSTPRDVKVAFVNQSGVEITWQSPLETGDQTHVIYDVNCLIRKICSIDDVDRDNCLYENCSRDVRYIPNNKGLKMNHVIVMGLSSFVNYTFKILAKNRVSEVAKRIYGDEGNFATLNIMIEGLEVSSSTAAPRTKAVPMLPLVVAKDQTTNEILDGFELDRAQLKLVKLLGTGNFGRVSKAIYGPSQIQVAVKSLKDNAEKEDLESIIMELEVMKSLRNHPHVVGLIGHCIEKDPVFIVLEHLPYGDLLGYLRKSRGIEDNYNTGEKEPSSALSEKDLLSFAWMIADGMDYLASMKVVHRDLAARNVLVGENRVCKISDFGLARSLQEDIYTRRTQARLPIKWMAPESIFNAESTTKSDVWSYGIVMWELFTLGGSPYPGVSVRKLISLLEGAYRMPKPNHVSEKLYAIMMECWNEQPQNRPTFKWIRYAVKRLQDDQQVYVNLEGYDDQEYLIIM